MQKHRFASISLTVRDRVISSKFSIHRVSKQCTIGNFQKIFLSLKMTAILNFQIFTENGKHRFASISLTVRDRAILLKFSTHRVSKQCTIGNFQKIFLSLKMTAILNFRIFTANGKHKLASISLTVRDRAISLKFLTPGVSIVLWRLFTKITFLPLLAAILNFCV